MRALHVGSLVVINDDRQPVGMITDRDICIEVVALEKDPKFDLMKGSLYKQFTDFAVHIHVDKATAEKIITQFAPEEDKALIKEKIEEQAKQAAAQNIVVNNDKNVTLALVLEKGELKLNGQVIPEEQVQGVLFMLIMSAAMQGK